jgi:hypothetical protein
MHSTESGVHSSTAHEPPVIIDLGKKPPKQIRLLRKGKGKLVHEVSDALEELKTAGIISKTVQPVIVIVGEQFEPKGLAALFSA